MDYWRRSAKMCVCEVRMVVLWRANWSKKTFKVEEKSFKQKKKTTQKKNNSKILKEKRKLYK